MCTEKHEILKEKGVFEDASIEGIKYAVYCAHGAMKTLGGLLVIVSAALAMAGL